MDVRRWLVVVVTTAVLGVSQGCLAPTLPLPPPSASVESLSAEGVATVTGRANPGAYVSCLNLRTNSGVIVHADPATGDFSLTILAQAGDGLQIWQDIGTNRSNSSDLCVECLAPTLDH